MNITLERVRDLLAREGQLYAEKRPKSKRLFEEARKNFVGGVPMSWMRIWAGGFPIFVDKAQGNKLIDVDALEYIDFCLGDTGALTGHAQPDIINALIAQMKKGITHMLPTEDCIWLGKELEHRFKLPYWYVFMTASDANRMALKLAREMTGRKKILAFNGCYHGSVDETLCVEFFGQMLNMPGAMGPILDDPSTTTRIVEFNDIEALEKALAPEDIACVITEPVMTNTGIIFPEPGFHDALRDITRKYGTLLLIDETHSYCAGPRGVTGEMNLDPDIFVLGKTIAGGYPAAVMGFTRGIAEKLEKRVPWHMFFGFGGTLSGNAAAIAGMKAAFTYVLNEENFNRMIPLARRMEEGIGKVIEDFGLPWYVARIGCRVEFRFLPKPPRNGMDTIQEVEYNAVDLFTEGLSGPLEQLIHVYCANRGILLTPVHEMALVGPTTIADDVDRYVQCIREMVSELVQ
ncbi:MAG: transaminase [Chitinophagales bacterium]